MSGFGILQQGYNPQPGINSGMPITRSNTTGPVKTTPPVSAPKLTVQQRLDQSFDLQASHQSPISQPKSTNPLGALNSSEAPVGRTISQGQINSATSLNLGDIENQPDYSKSKADFLNAVHLLGDSFGAYNDSCGQLGTLVTFLDNIFTDISSGSSADMLDDELSAVALIKEEFATIVDAISPNEKALIYHTLLKDGKFESILGKLTDSVELKMKGLQDEQDAIEQKIDQLDTKDSPDDKQEENKLEAEFKVLEYKISEQNAVKDSLLKCKYLLEVLQEKIPDGGNVEPKASWNTTLDYESAAVVDFVSRHKEENSAIMYHFIFDINSCQPGKRDELVQFYSARFGFEDCHTINDLAGKILEDKNLLSILNGELKFMGKDGRRQLLDRLSINLGGSDVNYQNRLSKHIETMNIALNLIEDEDRSDLDNKLITGKDELDHDVLPTDIIYDILQKKITIQTDEDGMIFKYSDIRNQKIKNFFKNIANLFASIFKVHVAVKSLQEEYLDKKVKEFVDNPDNIELFKSLYQHGLYDGPKLKALLKDMVDNFDSVRGVSSQEKEHFINQFMDSLSGKMGLNIEQKE